MDVRLVALNLGTSPEMVHRHSGHDNTKNRASEFADVWLSKKKIEGVADGNISRATKKAECLSVARPRPANARCPRPSYQRAGLTEAKGSEARRIVDASLAMACSDADGPEFWRTAIIAVSNLTP
jgi:hypothetical protein